MNIMSKTQAEGSIEVLTDQARIFRKNGNTDLAEQNERIIKRLQRRIDSGKYKDKES